MMTSAQTETKLSVTWRNGQSPRLPGLSDEDLLEQFLGPDKTASEDAFQELVRRHTPLVLGVCCNVLGHVQDAEDALQATFLILALQAGRIRNGRLLDPWLRQVASRVAIRFRTGSKRRRQHESQAAERSGIMPNHEHAAAWIELRSALRKEVDRLPPEYGRAIVLCYFEERSNEEAAALLCRPVGTVKSRLTRARAMLRTRLTRRGLACDRA